MINVLTFMLITHGTKTCEIVTLQLLYERHSVAAEKNSHSVAIIGENVMRSFEINFHHPHPISTWHIESLKSACSES